MNNLIVIKETDQGTSFTNLTRKIYLSSGSPMVKINGEFVKVDNQQFNGRPVLNMYQYRIPNKDKCFRYN